MDKYVRFMAKRTRRLAASEIRELLKLTEGKDIISFAGGLPDPAVFMREELAEIAKEVILTKGDKALQYSPTKGVTPFLETLKEFMRGHGTSVTDDDDIIVTTGAQEGIYLISKTFIDDGDIAITEEPTYLAAIQSMRFFKGKLIGIPVDEKGMRTEELEDLLRTSQIKVKLVYTNSTSQNPSGTTMSLDRRRHLLELASRYDFMIVEDDPYGYFVFEGERPASLKSLDKEGRVLYVSSFSKILAPGLRIGWVAGPKEVIRVIEMGKQNVDLHSSTLSQYIIMEAIKRGIVDQTIEKARALYKIKRDLMIEALEEHMRDLATWNKPIGGMFVMVKLNYDIDTRKLLPLAIQKGVAYVPGAPFHVSSNGSNTMRLNYSYPTPAQIRDGVRRLAEAIREFRAS